MSVKKKTDRKARYLALVFEDSGSQMGKEVSVAKINTFSILLCFSSQRYYHTYNLLVVQKFDVVVQKYDRHLANQFFLSHVKVLKLCLDMTDLILYVLKLYQTSCFL